MSEILMKDASRDDLRKGSKSLNRPSFKVQSQKANYYVYLDEKMYSVNLDSPKTKQALDELCLQESQFKELNDNIQEIYNDSTLNEHMKQVRLDHYNGKILKMIRQVNERRKQIINKEDIKEKLRNRSRIYTDSMQMRTESSPSGNQKSLFLRRNGPLGGSMSQERSYYLKNSQRVGQEMVREYNRTINYLKNNSQGPHLLSTSDIGASQQMSEVSVDFPIDKEVENFNRFKKLNQFKALQEYNQEMKRQLMKKQEEIRLEQMRINLKQKIKQQEEQSNQKKEKLKWQLYERNEEMERENKRKEQEKLEKSKKVESMRQESKLRKQTENEERQLRSQQRQRSRERIQENIEYIQNQEFQQCLDRKQQIENKQFLTEIQHEQILLKQKKKLTQKFQEYREVSENAKIKKQMEEGAKISNVIERIVKHEEHLKSIHIKKLKRQLKQQKELEEKQEIKMENQKKKQEEEEERQKKKEERQKNIEEYHQQKRMNQALVQELRQEQLKLKELEIKENEEIRKRQQDQKYQNLILKYRRIEELKLAKEQKKELIRKAIEQSTLQLHKESRRINDNITKVLHNIAGADHQNNKSKDFMDQQKKILLKILPEEEINQAEEMQKKLLTSFSQRGKPKDKLQRITNQDGSQSPNITII